MDDAAASLVESLAGLPRVKARVADDIREAEIPDGAVAIFTGSLSPGTGSVGTRFVRCVPAEPLYGALGGLARAQRDTAELRAACLAGDERGVLHYPLSQAVWASGEGREENAWMYVSVRSEHQRYLLCGPRSGPLREAEATLGRIRMWSSRLWNEPVDPPGQVFLTGELLELGGWRRARAVPLSCSSGYPGYREWSVELQVLLDTVPASVEFAYFAVPEPGAAPAWEPGRRGALQTFEEHSKLGDVGSWGLFAVSYATDGPAARFADEP